MKLNEKNSSYTAGPWIVEKNKIFTKQLAFFIAEVKSNQDMLSYTKGPKEAEANAKLIAAAPEMLSALEHIAADFDKDSPADYVRIVNDAITKAKGK